MDTIINDLKDAPDVEVLTLKGTGVAPRPDDLPVVYDATAAPSCNDRSTTVTSSSKGVGAPPRRKEYVCRGGVLRTIEVQGVCFHGFLEVPQLLGTIVERILQRPYCVQGPWCTE